MSVAEAEAEMRKQVEVMVAGGYLPLDQVVEDAADYLVGAYDELDDAALTRMAERLVEEVARIQAKKQAAWPVTTDCDRLGAAFVDLEKRDILCGQHTGYTQSDGAAEMMIR